MTYVSSTLPGVTRGPHEHSDQTDGFAFPGPSDFRLFLWDTRPDSPTHGRRWVGTVGTSNPVAVWIPPGVVHAYRNVGDVPGLVFNAPNRLFAGWGKKDPVDEIRHEDAEPGRFSMAD
jgi:dTDP-4-dehydrorhamnose 3,5-epimerase